MPAGMGGGRCIRVRCARCESGRYQVFWRRSPVCRYLPGVRVKLYRRCEADSGRYRLRRHGSLIVNPPAAESNLPFVTKCAAWHDSATASRCRFWNGAVACCSEAVAGTQPGTHPMPALQADRSTLERWPRHSQGHAAGRALPAALSLVQPTQSAITLSAPKLQAALRKDGHKAPHRSGVDGITIHRNLLIIHRSVLITHRKSTD